MGFDSTHLDITVTTHHDVPVRTTVAIDDDLLEKLKEAANKRREPLTKIVNETLRRGLSAQRARATSRTPFRVDTFESSFRAGIDPLRLNQVLDDLEVHRANEPRGR